MNRNRLVKKCVIVSAVFLLGSFLTEGGPAQAVRTDRDLPVMVSLRDLLSDPDRFDGHRVVVSGRVASIKLQKGRRGGTYIVLRLEALKSNPRKSRPAIKVFTLFPPPVMRGHEAVVQGKYVHKGRAGGISFENFIRADAIMKEPSQ